MRSFPFTLIPLVIFNLIAFLAPGWVDGPTLVDGTAGAVGGGWGTASILSLTLFSGQPWTLAVGDLMIIIGLVALFFEMMRSTTAISVGNHMLSILVAIAYVIEFFVVKQAGNSTFFILGAIALIDVLAGIAVTIRHASRDIAFQDGSIHHH